MVLFQSSKASCPAHCLTTREHIRLLPGCHLCTLHQTSMLQIGGHPQARCQDVARRFHILHSSNHSSNNINTIPTTSPKTRVFRSNPTHQVTLPTRARTSIRVALHIKGWLRRPRQSNLSFSTIRNLLQSTTTTEASSSRDKCRCLILHSLNKPRRDRILCGALMEPHPAHGHPIAPHRGRGSVRTSLASEPRVQSGHETSVLSVMLNHLDQQPKQKITL